MSRTIEQIQLEYSRAAAELGDLEFKRSLSEDEIEKINYQMGKRRSQMTSLSNEAKKIAEAAEEKKNEVALPVSEEANVSDQQ